MKRRIEPEQLLELTDEQLQKLQNWWLTELGDYMTDFSTEEDGRYFVGICKYIKPKSENKAIGFPLLDIAQMIQLLEEKDQCLNITKRTDLEGWGYEIILRHINYYDFSTGELADALWKAVKAVL